MLGDVLNWNSWANPKWIQSCKDSFSNESQVEFSSDTFTRHEYSSTVLTAFDKFVLAQLLFSSSLGDISHRRFSFSNTLLALFVIAEVVDCLDISRSLYSQIEDLKSDPFDSDKHRIIVQEDDDDVSSFHATIIDDEKRFDTPNSKKENSSKPQPSKPRIFKLVLSDGKDLVECVDLYGVFIEPPPKGYKLALTAGLEIQKNILILRPEYTLCLGGSLPLNHNIGVSDNDNRGNNVVNRSNIFNSIKDLEFRLSLKNK